MNSGTRRGETQTELSQNENEDHTQRFKVLSESIAAVKKVILTPGPFLGWVSDLTHYDYDYQAIDDKLTKKSKIKMILKIRILSLTLQW